jgi:hypothetical protein
VTASDLHPTCDHYELRGVVLAELGEIDPHLDGCAACRGLRSRHRALIGALAQIGADHQPPSNWQAQVWARIDREESRDRQRRSYALTAVAALVAVAAAVVLWFRAERVPQVATSIEIVAGETAMRATMARVGDAVRVRVSRGSAVWLYREDRTLVDRCDTTTQSPRCVASAAGLALESRLQAPGRYQIVVVPFDAPAPTGDLDRDVAAVAGDGKVFQLTEIDVW